MAAAAALASAVQWIPFDAHIFQYLADRYSAPENQFIMNAPVSDWDNRRKDALSAALGLSDSEHSKRIVNLIIACVTSAISEHGANISDEILIAKGWIFPSTNIIDRIASLEEKFSSLEEKLNRIENSQLELLTRSEFQTALDQSQLELLKRSDLDRFESIFKSTMERIGLSQK